MCRDPSSIFLTHFTRIDRFNLDFRKHRATTKPADILSFLLIFSSLIPSLPLCVCVWSWQGCGSLVSVSRSAGALSYRSTEDSSLPEILLGLIYNSATGQLSAEVIQGSHFKTTASEKPVSTYTAH